MDDVLALTGNDAALALGYAFHSRGFYVQPLHETWFQYPQFVLCLRAQSNEREIAQISLSVPEPGILCIENLDVFPEPGQKHRRTRIASKMTALSIEAGARHGLNTVTTLAVQLGGFYWAAIGFEPVQLDDGFSQCFNRHAHKIADEQLREAIATKIAVNDARVVYDIAKLTNRPRPGAPTLAHSIFAKTGWRGRFDTRNAVQVAQLRTASKLALPGLG